MTSNRSKKKLISIAVALVLIGITSIWGGYKDSQKPVATPVSDVKSVSTQATPSSILNSLPEGQEAVVSGVIDGDTIEIDSGQKVRYTGIDTPETVDPRRPVGCFGKEASNENKKLVGGKTIILVKDISETDKFGRLLRYVYLKDNGVFVNDYLVRNGFAKVSTYPPDVRFNDQFLQAETEARENSRGLFQACK